MQAFWKLIQSLISEREELENKKFLGYFRLEELMHLEGWLGTSLGIQSQRKTRPFIGAYKGDLLLVCFLTSQSRGKKREVNIGLCSRKGCPAYDFARRSYLFFDTARKGYYIYELPKEYFKNKYVFCGFCEDMEFFDQLPIYRTKT